MSGSPIKIKCQKTVIKSGERHFPIYVGFLPARDLADIASVPSFGREDQNVTIVKHISGEPIEGWQRPPIEEKIAAIEKKFSEPGQLMPNPVLLSAGSDSEGCFDIQQEQTGAGYRSSTWIVSITVPSTGRKPLWILDGQHRILGLSKSRQKSNPVPLVLLLDTGETAYTPGDFAQIFAQVTTQATPLRPLHNEWLTFAFGLGKYENEDQREAMRVVNSLCIEQKVDAGLPNPFYDRIRYNPSQDSTGPRNGGFAYDCIKWQELIYNHYCLKRSASSESLGAKDVAEQLALSYIALTKSVSGDPLNTVFFAKSTAGGIVAMQDAFIIGVLTRLVSVGVPDSWDELLQQLNFHGTDWDFRAWVRTTGGSEGNATRNIAERVLRDAFEMGKIPAEAESIATYLEGDKCFVSLEASFLTNKLSPKRSERVQKHIEPGVATFSVGARKHLKIPTKCGCCKLSNPSLNVHSVTVIDESQPFGKTFDTKALKKGVLLDESNKNGSVRLMLRFELFGGIVKESTVTVKWDL